MLNYATDFQNPQRWAGLAPDIQKSMKRLLQDRFWQNGISNESRDAFVSRVSNSKDSFEGFGSTVRRSIRQIRVGSCDLLLLFSKFGESFYGIPDLGDPLSVSIIDHSEVLSAHHFSVLITFASQIINYCPANLRRQVLPPLLAKLFQVMRFKIESEWEAVNRRTEQNSVDDNLDDEMKNQSILRSMTYNACYLLFSMLEKQSQFQRQRGEHSIFTLRDMRLMRTAHAAANQQQLGAEDFSNSLESNPDSLFSIATGNETVLEPVLLFISSALRVRDTHSVGCVLSALRDILPSFSDPSPVRSYICNDILKAAITSLHEPYFVDLQKDLATLIVHIILLDADLSGQVISSLPGLSQQPQKVVSAIARVRASPSEKVGRAVVLDLLEQIRGVSIHEMGRIGGPKKSRGTAKLLAQLEMQVQGQQHQNSQQTQQQGIRRGGSPDLEGVANLLEG
jgi:exportin-5